MSRKRKYTLRSSPDYTTGAEGSPSQPSSSSALFVQAHEATIIRDRPDLAEALTAHDHGGGKGGLIQWQAEGLPDGQEVWVDRYDARLLLTCLPTADHTPVQPPSSPTGWSDLPSDAEDTFFLSPSEIEDVQREKRRKLMDTGREARLRAMRESDPDPARGFEEDRELWGGDDEEPDDAQRTLMERTAKHLHSSPNPGQLEMRILANHGADQRFAFLRGRWRIFWQAIKLAAKVEDEAQQRSVQAAENMSGGLVAYGDSDDDDEDEQEDQGDTDSQKAVVSKETDMKEKEARRARAREWARKRKEGKTGDE